MRTLFLIVGFLLAAVVVICAFAPWLETGDAARAIRSAYGNDALMFSEAALDPAVCDGVGLTKVPFGVRVGGPPCPAFANGRASYLVTFWGQIL